MRGSRGSVALRDATFACESIGVALSAHQRHDFWRCGQPTWQHGADSDANQIAFQYDGDQNYNPSAFVLNRAIIHPPSGFQMPPEMSDRKAEVKKQFGLSADRATVPPLLFFALPRSRRNWLAMLAPRAIFVGPAGMGCSGGNTGGGRNTGTSSSTYSATVTGTSSQRLAIHHLVIGRE